MRYLSLFLLPVCLLAGCSHPPLVKDFSTPEKTLDTLSVAKLLIECPTYLEPEYLEELKKGFSEHVNGLFSYEDFFEETERLRELRKIERYPTEYYEEFGNQYASIYMKRKYWWGKGKELLYNFIKESDGWKIELKYRVFLSTPGEAVNGLKASISSSKKVYHRGEDLELEITLTNVGNKDIIIIGDRWEYGENILLKIVKLPEFEDASLSPHAALVDYSFDTHFLTLRPSEAVTKELKWEDGVTFLPAFGALEPGKYQIFFVYVPHMGFSRDRPVEPDEWRGRVTSEPIEIEIAP